MCFGMQNAGEIQKAAHMQVIMPGVYNMQNTVIFGVGVVCLAWPLGKKLKHKEIGELNEKGVHKTP